MQNKGIIGAVCGDIIGSGDDLCSSRVASG